jgi:hypothetical protein
MKEVILGGKYGKGKVALVDDEDYDRIIKYSWYIAYTGIDCRKFYVRRGTWNGKRHSIGYLHREVMNITGKVLIDHIDGDTLNNQKSNLRIATYAENSANQIKKISATSKYLGVSKRQYFNNFKKEYIITWSAVCVNGNKRYYKSFRTEIEAALQYNEFAKELHGEFASLNIIREQEIVANNKFISEHFCNENEKVCSACKKKLTREKFSKTTHGKGMCSKCKECQRIYSKARYEKIKNDKIGRD